MDSNVTVVTRHQGLASACCHSLDPQWFFLPSFFVQVCEFADVMNFDILTGPAKFAFVRKEPFDKLITALSIERERLVVEDCLRLSCE